MSRDGSSARKVSGAHVDAAMRASRAFAGVTAASIAAIDDVVTMPQLRILVMIDVRGPLNVNAVAAALDIAASNASRACDRLAKAGLIDRREFPGDRRNVNVTLTDAGQDLVDRVTAHRRAALERIMRRMRPEERAGLAASFDEFADAAGEPADHHL